MICKNASCQLKRKLLPIRLNAAHRCARKYSGTAPSLSTRPLLPHLLTGVTSQLDQISPRYELDAADINILHTPTEFYKTLKQKIQSARRQIYISTLYIGKAEDELIKTLDAALCNRPDLQASILTDALRGTREHPGPSCASLLARLAQKYGDRIKISMYHTPNLTGWRKRFLPKRINEGWGLQHMKLYGFDDEVMLSGANLSQDYFTNRLDRYYIFSSKELTNHFRKVHDAICDISYRVALSDDRTAAFTLESPIVRGLPDPVLQPERFKEHASSILEPLISTTTPPAMSVGVLEKQNTLVYPVAQFDSLLSEGHNISTEKPSLVRILKALSEEPTLRNSHLVFTAGYFNLDPDISRALIEAVPSEAQIRQLTPSQPDTDIQPSCTVITASPWANGFYNSKGISGMLPAAYTLLSRRFLNNVAKAARSSTIQLKEWRRGTVGKPGGWTYHAKGLWLTLPKWDGTSSALPSPSQTRPSIDEETTTRTSLSTPVGPSLTLIGSSNYTKRSYSLDLEVGALVVTNDETLQRRMMEETEKLQEDALVTSSDDLRKAERRVGLKVRMAMWLVEKLGGAL